MESRQIQSVSDQRRDLTIVTIWAAATALMLLTARVRFLVNDDIPMEAIASGRYDGRPGSNLVFLGFLVSKPLQLLYHLARDVPWYGLSLIAFSVAGLGTVLAVSLRRRHLLPRPLRWVAPVVTVALTPFFVLTPTFTTTSFILATAAVATATTLDCPSSKSACRRLIAVTGFAVCSLSVRFDGAIGVAVVAAPVLIALAITIPWRRTALLGALSVSATAAVLMVDRVFLNRGPWRAFNEYNEVRGAVQDTVAFRNFAANSSSAAMHQLLASNRWTMDDIRLLSYWVFDDPRVYSLEKMRNLRSAVAENATSSPLREAWSFVVDGRIAFMVGLLVVALLCALVGRRSAVLAGVLLAWTATVSVRLAESTRFPHRVAVPIIVALFVLLPLGTALVSVSRRERADWRVPTSWLLAGLLACSLVVAVSPDFTPWGISRTNAEGIDGADARTGQLRAIDPEGVFVLVSPAAADALGADGSLPANVLPLGWPTFSPADAGRRRDFRLGADSFLSAIDRPHVYFVLHPVAMETFARNKTARYHLRVRVERVATLTPTRSVYRVVSVPGTAR